MNRTLNDVVTATDGVSSAVSYASDELERLNKTVESLAVNVARIAEILEETAHDHLHHAKIVVEWLEDIHDRQVEIKREMTFLDTTCHFEPSTCSRD